MTTKDQEKFIHVYEEKFKVLSQDLIWLQDYLNSKDQNSIEKGIILTF